MLGKATEWGILEAPPRIKLFKEPGREIIIGPQAEAKLPAAANGIPQALVLSIPAGSTSCSCRFFNRGVIPKRSAYATRPKSGILSNSEQRILFRKCTGGDVCGDLWKKAIPEAWGLCPAANHIRSQQ